eukprot:6589812-Prymnesium_polylepis.1
MQGQHRQGQRGGGGDRCAAHDSRISMTLRAELSDRGLVVNLRVPCMLRNRSRVDMHSQVVAVGTTGTRKDGAPERRGGTRSIEDPEYDASARREPW